MKINDIIREGKKNPIKGKIPTDANAKAPGEWLFRDDGTDRAYNLNRIMMATAMADGKNTTPLEMDQASWVEKNNVARPYSEEEHKMMQQAFATVPGQETHSVKHHKSVETDDTDKHSPVAGNYSSASIYNATKKRKKKK
jgi:hypothetical protein